MTNSDEEEFELAISELEAQIPELAALATSMAYEKAKQSGQIVVVSKNGFIIAEHPDGTEVVLATCKPLRKVKAHMPFVIGKNK